MNFSRKIYILFLICYFTCSAGALAQQTYRIRLLDDENAMPITDAHYIYGDQTGISDAAGTITFYYSKGDTMNISHVSYGSWKWSDEELQDVMEQQVYYRRSTIISLYPVTVISVRAVRQPEDKLIIDFQERMEHDGAAILNQIPAINSIRKSGNYGFDPVFRGYKYDQLNVVLNGAQSATAACPNRMDPPTSQMAPNMTDRIEIIKGPHGLRFGTGFGGTINFIPSKLQFTSNPDIYGRLSSGYESNGNIFRSEGQFGFSGSQYDLSIFGAWSQGNDYTTGNEEAVQANFLRGSFGTNIGVKLSLNQQLRVSAMYNLARDADFPALPMDLREDDTWLFNARHDMYIKNRSLQSWNIMVFGSFVNHLMNNLLKPLDPRMLNAETSAQTYNYGIRTENIWQFSNSKLFAGADLKVEGAKGIRKREFLMGPNAGNTLEDNAWQDSRISKTGIFGEFHLNTHLFNFVFSGRLELNHAELNDPVTDFTTVYPETSVSQINPSLSAGIQKLLGKTVKTGFWIGRAQRSGSLTERYINYFPVGQDPYEMLGNPRIYPEINNQIDLTFEWKTKKTVLDIDLFGSYLQHYISSVIDTNMVPRLPMSPGVRQFFNIDKAFKTGFELNWTQQYPFGLQNQLGIAYTYARDLERNEPLPEISPMDLRFTLRGEYLNSKFTPEAVFRYVFKQSRISREFGETSTPSFALLDIKLGYKISDKIRFNAGVNNVFDTNYYEHLSRSVHGTNNPIYAVGRSMYIHLNIIF